MNAFQKAVYRRQVMIALKRMEAKRYTLLRIPRDANGMPAGIGEPVGVFFGLRYIREDNFRSLLIAMPGITLDHAQNERVFGVMLDGGTPKIEDTLIELPELGRIMEVREHFGIYVLTMEGTR